MSKLNGVIKMNETKELILNKLGELTNLFPEQRLGQIIYNYILRQCPNNDCFYISDEQLLAILEIQLNEFKIKRTSRKIDKLLKDENIRSKIVDFLIDENLLERDDI